MKTNNRKIDIFVYGKYFASTTRYKTCKEAIKSVYIKYPDFGIVTANFSEKIPLKAKKHYYNTRLPQKNCICRLCLQLKNK